MKNNVEFYRKKLNLTQEELAQKLGVSRQTIHSIESEKYQPSIVLAFKFSKLFNVSIEDLFIYEE
jgi:putative transcriptional regulator